MDKHTQTIRRLLPTNSLSVFDHFVRLAFKGLKYLIKVIFEIKPEVYSEPCQTSKSSLFSEVKNIDAASINLNNNLKRKWMGIPVENELQSWSCETSSRIGFFSQSANN